MNIEPDTTSSGESAAAKAMEHQTDLYEQALQFEGMLPVLLRKLFTLQPDHPASDVPVAQLRTCTILQSGPRTMTSLSDELGISLSAMTQIADRMERAGIVERVMIREDRRQRLLQLSERGTEMMRTRKQIRIRQAAMALENISDSERGELLRLLHVLLGAARSLAPENKFDLANEEVADDVDGKG
jgi:DNA-binding MarR family transcriptional regulator